MSISNEEFNEFACRASQEIASVQEEFMKIYDINSYENWYYDYGIGVFHFHSDDDRHLYFKYPDVGSYSNNSNTWNWSWDNESTPLAVSYKLEKVKEFGETNKYFELTTGLIDGDEYTGWEMASISARLLDGLGMYRIPQEHLHIYFVFTNEVTAEDYQILKDKVIKCDEHETGITSFVCCHLLEASDKGFHEAFETEPGMELHEDDDYQAWCNECEAERLKTDGWNDESTKFANIKIVCDNYYFEIKRRNIAT